jgi:hypothetical protein
VVRGVAGYDQLHAVLVHRRADRAPDIPMTAGWQTPARTAVPTNRIGFIGDGITGPSRLRHP